MIWRTVSVLLISLFVCGVALAQGNDLEQIMASHGDAVNSVAVLSGGETVVAMKAGQKWRLVVISLRDCAENRRFVYDEEITGIVALKGDSGAVWGGQGDMLKKWNILDGKELVSLSALPEETVKGISQDRDGEYLAVWGNNKVAAFKVSGDNATPVWGETLSFRVSGVIIDPRGGHMYISGYDGSILKRTMLGTVANSFVLDRAIYSMDIDPHRQILLLAMGDQLLKLDIESTAFTRITSLPTDDIVLSGDGKTLSTLGGGVYTVYSYPAMKAIRTQNLKGNKLVVLPNGGAVTFADNTLNFYDQLKQSQAGRVYILDSGTGFVSPELNYYGNDLFRTAIAGNSVSGVPPYIAESKAPDMNKACSALKEMITLVYPPSAPSVSRPAVNSPATPTTPKSTPVNTAGTTPIPKSTPLTPTAQVQAPSSPPSPASAANTAEPQKTAAAPVVQAPQMPQVKPVITPTLAQGTDVPLWAIRQNSLPAFSAVKSGKDGAQALNEGKKKIRDDVARTVMKNMLDIELVKNIESDELKKRFLWQVGARTGQIAGDYAMQKDVWVSQDGTYYVLAYIDNKNVDQIYEPIFQEEMKILRSYGDAEYLKNEPVKWE